jgi:hypothetical protein
LDSNRRLTGQRKHLVRGDSGYNRRIAATNLANRFLHAASPEFSNVSQHRGESLFSFGYVLGFTHPQKALRWELPPNAAPSVSLRPACGLRAITA